MEKQQFKTVDIVIILVMAVTVVGLSIGIVKHNRSQNPENQVYRMAENISSQLLHLDRKNFHSMGVLPQNDLRIPSSSESKKKAFRLGPEGVIGEDPWGSPFQYRFVESPEGEWSHLIVWSKGPDSRASKPVTDWTYETLVASSSSKTGRKIHLDDDFGLIFSLE